MKPLLEIDILTLFPQMFLGPLSESLIEKAQSKGLIRIRLHNLRDYTLDKHRHVDDKPFGGGPGMVLKVEPIFNALKKLSVLPRSKNAGKKKGSQRPYVVYLSPQGKKLEQPLVQQLSQRRRLVLICGHYEGIDDRIMKWVDEEISIGDYVLTGGEIPAMVVVDSISRMIPGVVKERESVRRDSFYSSSLDCSHYTRPAKFLGMQVPGVLLSGNHMEIEMWREENSAQNTMKKRPDLLASPSL